MFSPCGRQDLFKDETSEAQKGPVTSLKLHSRATQRLPRLSDIINCLPTPGRFTYLTPFTTCPEELPSLEAQIKHQLVHNPKDTFPRG